MTSRETAVTSAGHSVHDADAELVAEDLVAEDLVEEVSIDGMCGVY